MAEEQSSSLFEVPEEPLFIRVPRARLIGIATAFLVFTVILGLLTGMPLGGAMGLMLLFTGPIGALVIYFIHMYMQVWKAYRYSGWLLRIVYILGFILSVLGAMLSYYL